MTESQFELHYRQPVIRRMCLQHLPIVPIGDADGVSLGNGALWVTSRVAVIVLLLFCCCVLTVGGSCPTFWIDKSGHEFSRDLSLMCLFLRLCVCECASLSLPLPPFVDHVRVAVQTVHLTACSGWSCLAMTLVALALRLRSLCGASPQHTPRSCENTAGSSANCPPKPAPLPSHHR